MSAICCLKRVQSAEGSLSRRLLCFQLKKQTSNLVSPIGEEDRMEERLCDEAGEGVLRLCGVCTRASEYKDKVTGKYCGRNAYSDAHAQLKAQIIAEGLSV